MRPDFLYFDSHSHLNLSDFDGDREAAIARLEEYRTGTIAVGVDRQTSMDAVALSTRSAYIYACIGQHPTDSKEDFDAGWYEELARNDRVVAIGECGLDYFRGADDAEKARQRKMFIEHIDLAVRIGKPLMLHVRPTKGSMNAYEEALDILERYKAEHGDGLRGNAHFFVGDTTIAQRFVALGFTMSFPGVITFAREYDEVLRSVPLDMVLSETDAPFVAPAPHRGQRNEPVFVREVVQKIAEIRGEDSEKVRLAIVQNAHRVFGL